MECGRWESFLVLISVFLLSHGTLGNHFHACASGRFAVGTDLFSTATASNHIRWTTPNKPHAAVPFWRVCVLSVSISLAYSAVDVCTPRSLSENNRKRYNRKTNLISLQQVCGGARQGPGKQTAMTNATPRVEYHPRNNRCSILALERFPCSISMAHSAAGACARPSLTRADNHKR